MSDELEYRNNGEPVSTMSDWEAEAAAERFAKVCRQHLRETYPDDSEIVEEYIGEAEHQDGYQYWLVHFLKMEELDDDFKVYCDNRGPVEGDMDEKGEYRIFSSHMAALPYLSLSLSSFELKVSMHRPDRMHLTVILRDEEWNTFRIDGEVIHTFKLNTWKEVLRVAGQLWRISARLERL